MKHMVHLIIESITAKKQQLMKSLYLRLSNTHNYNYTGF